MKLIARLSKPDITIRQLLKEGHGLTGPIINWAGIVGSEVYYGIAYAGEPAWMGFIMSGTPNMLGTLDNSGTVCLIFIPIDNRWMCFSFGHTISKLNVIWFEKDFGLKVVLNTVNHEKLKSIDSKTVDTVIVNKRTQLSKENKIQNFGFEINKDLLRSVAGKPSDSSFASSVSGSETLFINCDITSNTLYQKVQEIYRHYTSAVYRANYEWIDNIKPVKDLLLISQLDEELVNQFNLSLAGDAESEMQLASPDILEISSIDHFKIKGYRSRSDFSLPNFDDLINDLITYEITAITIRDLESYNIEAISGDNQTVSRWSVYNWLICEIDIDNTKYILSDGEWYEISSDYFRSVETVFDRITSNSREYQRIGTTNAENETQYFSDYVLSSNEIILDGKLFYEYGGHNSIEICDIYNSDRRFIHVKDGGSSSKLSHLFNQGLVSAQLFVSDQNFQRDLKTKLIAKPVLRSTITSPIETSQFHVVFRILKPGTVLNLPFFTKIVLNDAYRRIKAMGYKFKLEWVQKTRT